MKRLFPHQQLPGAVPQRLLRDSQVKFLHPVLRPFPLRAQDHPLPLHRRQQSVLGDGGKGNLPDLRRSGKVCPTAQKLMDRLQQLPVQKLRSNPLVADHRRRAAERLDQGVAAVDKSGQLFALAAHLQLHLAEPLAVGEQFYIIPLYAMKSVNLVNPEVTGIRQIPASGSLEYRYADIG